MIEIVNREPPTDRLADIEKMLRSSEMDEVLACIRSQADAHSALAGKALSEGNETGAKVSVAQSKRYAMALEILIGMSTGKIPVSSAEIRTVSP